MFEITSADVKCPKIKLTQCSQNSTELKVKEKSTGKPSDVRILTYGRYTLSVTCFYDPTRPDWIITSDHRLIF